ncbi:DinB superfamily protein [Catalinimonas alkaloidigena]|uniref:DinB superfamily protein n=1 Tax=Catalinimonas alkaloidigena TaxID=1075417 RepID=A0A1G9PCQ3_9BACT|nr:DinB family protein [Catalinimonas alkaloidigena]SDL96550.1 DinB superfamily protein [Catalinimonas alkaloidigena]
MQLSPPTSDEYAPFYATYVSQVSPDGLTSTLPQQHTVLQYLKHLSDDQAQFRYAPGKWSVKEVIGHMADTERIFAYRLLRIGRGDQTPLPGFDQNPYVEAAQFDRRSIADLVEEFMEVRTATLRLFHTLQPADWERRGTASQAPVSARALAYIIAGHAQHHLGILRERYALTW